MKNIFIELFRFDKDTDYLPYYKKYNLKVEENISINELLELINAKDEFGFEQGCNLKINNIFLNSSEILSSVIEKFGNELKIEPISIYRATKDLIIDNKDFIDKTNIFAEFLEDEDMQKAIQDYELDYYASNTLNFNKDYIGEHNLYLASKILEDKPQLKDELMDILSDKEIGAYFHTSLKDRIFNFDEQKEEKVNTLLSMIPKNKPLKDRVIQTKEFNEKSSSFLDFNIAVYEGGLDLGLEKLVLNSGANLVSIDSKDFHIPYECFEIDKKFPMALCAEVLLEAKDSGADFILIGEENTFEFFDAKQKLVEKYIKRDINLPVITKAEFISLLEGNRDKSMFSSHKVGVSFL